MLTFKKQQTKQLDTAAGRKDKSKSVTFIKKKEMGRLSNRTWSFRIVFETNSAKGALQLKNFIVGKCWLQSIIRCSMPLLLTNRQNEGNCWQ